MLVSKIGSRWQQVTIQSFIQLIPSEAVFINDSLNHEFIHYQNI